MRRLALALALFSPLAACKDSPKFTPVDADEPDGPPGPIDGPTADTLPATCTARPGTNVALGPAIAGFDAPVGLTAPPDDPRIFVVEQSGAIRVIKNGALLPTPFIDLSGPVLAGGERGLLGLAFHPQFATNGRFYVNFTRDPDGATVIGEYTAPAGSDVATPGSFREVLRIPQPFSNHNAGWLTFGPDGKLYIAMGDGGSGGDPGDRAQNDRELLGKMLRIDVDTRTGSKGYGIPADNPFASSPDGTNDPRPEIWGKGLRNPFRFSFDRGTGDLYIGDVGQNAWEEVNAHANTAGVNWGWDDREGANCFEPTSGCLTANRTDPVVQHSAGSGWRSVIGGEVYRGTCFPDLVGQYFYGDYSQGGLWAFRLVGGVAQNDRQVIASVGSITHVAADARGELYVVTHDGRVRPIIIP